MLRLVMEGLGWMAARVEGGFLRFPAAFLAWFWRWFLPIRRDVGLENLEHAFPLLSAKARRELLERNVYHLAWNVLEFIAAPYLSHERLAARFDWVGLEHLDKAREKGRGVLILSAHLGAFDLLVCAAAAKGIPLTIVSRSARSQGVEEIWMGYRRRFGIEIVGDRQCIPILLRALKRGRVVVLLIDQNVKAHAGVFVPFFGRLACTSPAPALLAARSRAPIVPVFVRRLKEGRHRVVFGPPFSIRRGGQPAFDSVSVTSRFSAMIEDRIREAPDEWLWLHRRWKTRPEADQREGHVRRRRKAS